MKTISGFIVRGLRTGRGIFLGFVVCGLFMANARSAQTIGGIILQEVSPRILTPNGDLLNDSVIFRFDSGLTGIPIDSAIFDINGSKIAGISIHPTDDHWLTWNGTDEGGQRVPSGIYIYKIKIGKNMATGTIVVAR